VRMFPAGKVKSRRNYIRLPYRRPGPHNGRTI
jgi:hypothetical protein